MRILVNAVAARRGGGAHHLGPFVSGLTEELPEADISVYVTAAAPELPCLDRVTWKLVDVPAGIKLQRLWWDNVTVARRARDYDLVVSPLNFGSLWCRPPHVLFQRNALYFDPAYSQTQPPRIRLRLVAYRWLASLQSNAADAVVVPTEAMAALLRPRLRKPAKVIVAPHSIDVERCQYLARQPLIEGPDSWARRQVRLLHIGSPAAHKGLDTLAHTFVEVSRTMSDFDIGLAVTFDEDDTSLPAREFRSIVDAAGLLDHISWLGTVPHDAVFPLYATADVLLLPSRVESFGYPVLEAMAVGCPVVASDLPAFREVSFGSASLHPVGSHIQAAQMVLDLLRGPLANQQAPPDTAANHGRNHQAQVVANLARRLTHPASTILSRTLDTHL